VTPERRTESRFEVDFESESGSENAVESTYRDEMFDKGCLVSLHIGDSRIGTGIGRRDLAT
jgi:hypothetical protein